MGVEPVVERAIPVDPDRKIESLTVNLLECFEELDLVYRLSRVLKPSHDAERSARVILAEACEIFEADLGFFAPCDPATSGCPTLVEGAATAVVERLRGPVLAELERRGRSQIFHPVARELGVAGDDLPEALLCAAVRTETALHGALCVGRPSTRGLFTARDLKLADVLAFQAALAIEHAVLHRRWREEEQAMIRIAEEMRLAREIQSNLLPTAAPTVPGYDIACRGIPAHSVGGDYYDFIPLESGSLALCLADVSGKGMPAALLMANLQATIRCQALAHAAPGECARRANRLLFHSTDSQRFATCFYGLLEPASGRLEYSNAGHDYPLLVSPEGSVTTLSAGGLLLGMMEEQRYEQGRVDILPGHLLVLYSDGITEAIDPPGRWFGLEGLHATLGQARHRPAADIVEAILAAATAHADGRPQGDDMTLVVLRRL